jgi:hypothetical protein
VLIVSQTASTEDTIMNLITFTPHRPPANVRRPQSQRLELELLEARNLLSFTNVLVNNPAEDTIPKQDTQSETAIVLGANSNVVVAYNDTGALSYPTPFNPTVTGYSLSTNAGASFTDKGQLPSSPPYWAFGDPVLARSSKTGTIFMSTTSVNTNNSAVLSVNLTGEQINIFRSQDNGASFSGPIDGTPGFVPLVDFQDKPWVAVDNYAGPGYGNVYLAWADLGSPTGENIGEFFTRSTDDGLTWGPTGGVTIGDKFDQNAFVTIGPDHTVYVFSWNGSKPSENIQMTKSTDQGQTFSQPVVVAKLKTNGSPLGDLGLTYSNTNSSSFRSHVFPQAAVNPATGDIYVVYHDESKENSNDKADIFFTMSTDGGNTWSSPLRVNDDMTTTDQWQPALALTPDGTHLFITWYDRRNDPANDSLIDRYGVIGAISGHTVSFAPNFRITDVSFPPAFGQDPDPATTYMGDYDMATADNNYFYTTWGDNRNGDQWFAHQPDVRFAKIPVTEEDGPTATAAATTAVQSLSPAVSLDPTLLLPSTTTTMPAMATTVTPVWSAPPVRKNSPPAVSGTASAPHIQATDAIFAAAGQAPADDGTWLASSLSAPDVAVL